MLLAVAGAGVALSRSDVDGRRPRGRVATTALAAALGAALLLLLLTAVTTTLTLAGRRRVRARRTHPHQVHERALHHHLAEVDPGRDVVEEDVDFAHRRPPAVAAVEAHPPPLEALIAAAHFGKF